MSPKQQFPKSPAKSSALTSPHTATRNTNSNVMQTHQQTDYFRLPFFLLPVFFAPSAAEASEAVDDFCPCRDFNKGIFCPHVISNFLLVGMSGLTSLPDSSFSITRMRPRCKVSRGYAFSGSMAKGSFKNVQISEIS